MAGRLGGGFSGYRPVLRESLDWCCLWPPTITGTHTLHPSRLRVGICQAWTRPDGLFRPTGRLRTVRLPPPRLLPQLQRPPVAARPRAGAQLGPFAGAQCGISPRGVGLGGRQTPTPQAWGGARARAGGELEWGEADARPPSEQRRGDGEAGWGQVSGSGWRGK